MNGRQGPRILITRLSHIGDCLLTLPLAVELRRQYPDCYLAWLSEPASVPLLSLHPAIDEVLTVPRKWLFKWRVVKSLRATLREKRFDMTIDPQGLLKSAAAAYVSGARLRVGFQGEHGREGSAWLNNRLVAPRSTHLVDRTLELLGLIPLPKTLGSVDLGLPLCTKAEERLSPFLSNLSEKYFVLNPGGNWPSKRWDPRNYGTLAEMVRQEMGWIPLVTWGGDEESQMADEIIAASCGAATKAPATSLRELAVLLAGAECFIGGDTGPLHLAEASGTRCIALHGPTRPEDSGVYGRQHLSIQRHYQKGTRRQRRTGTNLAMQTIAVADVFEKVQLVASQRSAPSRPVLANRPRVA